MTELTRPTPPPYPWADRFFTIGVTGTNGKTSTTRLITSILRADGRSVLTETTIGYDLDDVPLDVARTVNGYLTAFGRAAEAGAKDAVVEVTSHALARGYAKLWRFDLAVFTNLSRDHLADHGSWEHYLASKAQLFVHLGPGRSAVLNASDEMSELVDQVTPPDVKRVWYACPTRGKARVPADLSAAFHRALARRHPHHPRAISAGREPRGAIETKLVGHVFAENALAAAGAGLAAGIPGETVARGLRDCPPIPGRFQIVAREPVLVAVDYAHTPDALARTCDAARSLAKQHRVLVVFGAGGGTDPEKREPMGRAVGERADLAFVTNDNPRTEDPKAIARAVSGGCRRGGRAYLTLELDCRAAIEQAIGKARPGDVVIVAGKGHERGQTIGTQTLPFSDVEEVERIVGKST